MAKGCVKVQVRVKLRGAMKSITQGSFLSNGSQVILCRVLGPFEAQCLPPIVARQQQQNLLLEMLLGIGPSFPIPVFFKVLDPQRMRVVMAQS